MQRIHIGLLCLAICSPSLAQGPSTESDLASLSWFTGHWRSEEGGKISEEFWTSPEGNVMLGVNRSMAAEGKTSFEYLRIADTVAGPTYFASPSGGPPTPFVLKQVVEGKRATFENKEHDFPQRIIYERVGNKLTARIEGTDQRSMEWQWQRVPSSRGTEALEGGDHIVMQGLRTVVYKVKDLAEAKAWYAEAFGLEPYFDQPFYVGFNIGGYELGLDPDTEGVSFGNNQPAYWGVDDCKASYERLIKLGAKPESAPRDVGEGIIVASVRDPFGNTLGVIQNPHFRLP